MIDRTARDRLAQAIDAYLDEQLTSFAFDERITAISDTTDDETVTATALGLWACYDDLKDHKAALSKEQWDYIQRLLLLLRCNGELHCDARSVWTRRQMLAAAALACWLAVVLATGLGTHLLIANVVLGAVPLGIEWLRLRRRTSGEPERAARLQPFGGMAEMLAARRSAPEFRKRQCPKQVANRRIRTATAERLLHLRAAALTLLFSPVVLFFLVFPDVERTSRVVLCGASGSES